MLSMISLVFLIGIDHFLIGLNYVKPFWRVLILVSLEENRFYSLKIRFAVKKIFCRCDQRQIAKT